MNENLDWLAQTWEIKEKLAEEFAGVTPAEQLKMMRAEIAEEWRKRGWTLNDAPANVAQYIPGRAKESEGGE